MTTKLLLPYPDDYEWPNETVMSNCDHSINRDIAERMKEEKIICQYAGWNFCGWCWWTGEQYACNVWVYHQHKATILADTLDEIMDQACEEFGYD
jgi:hypothetical protein